MQTTETHAPRASDMQRIGVIPDRRGLVDFFAAFSKLEGFKPRSQYVLVFARKFIAHMQPDTDCATVRLTRITSGAFGHCDVFELCMHDAAFTCLFGTLLSTLESFYLRIEQAGEEFPVFMHYHQSTSGVLQGWDAWIREYFQLASAQAPEMRTSAQVVHAKETVCT